MLWGGCGVREGRGSVLKAWSLDFPTWALLVISEVTEGWVDDSCVGWFSRC